MKIIHWTIIFILIIVPFSLVCRNIINTRFVALKDEVRINNAIDTATYDAVDLLIEVAEVSDDKKIELNPTLCEETINQFFRTMCVNYNMPFNDESKAYLQAYIPAIIIVGYDGFYIYSAEKTANGVEHILKPKIPYAYEDDYGNIINFTLTNELKIFCKNTGKTFSGVLDYNVYDEDGAISDEIRAAQNLYGNISVDDLSYITTDLSYILYKLENNFGTRDDFSSFLLKGDPANDYKYDANGILLSDAGEFHQKRREVITNLITSALKEEVMEHNSYAELLGVSYNFTVPDISKEQWINAIDDISVLSFIQGIPVGINQYYNNYALGGSRITRGNYIYGDVAKNRYHKENCTEITSTTASGEKYLDYDKIKDIFFNKQAAALSGYNWCPICEP